MLPCISGMSILSRKCFLLQLKPTSRHFPFVMGVCQKRKWLYAALAMLLLAPESILKHATIADDLIVMGEQLGYKIRAGALFGMKEYSLAETDCRRFLGF